MKTILHNTWSKTQTVFSFVLTTRPHLHLSASPPVRSLYHFFLHSLHLSARPPVRFLPRFFQHFPPPSARPPVHSLYHFFLHLLPPSARPPVRSLYLFYLHCLSPSARPPVRLMYLPFLLSLPLLAETQVNDNFSDGNLSLNPAWIGDVGMFEVNTALQLHLNTTGSDTACLMTMNARTHDTEWSFWVKLSFNTSANNFARIYLMADTSLLMNQLNGYFLQLGGSDDSITIIKQTGSLLSTIYRFKSYKTSHSTNTLRLKIIRDGNGIWETMIDTTGGISFILDGTFSDHTHSTARWFGVWCRFTSSNATKFYFDDLYVGPVQRDTIAPALIHSEATTRKCLMLKFSEPVETGSATDPLHFLVVSTNAHPDSVHHSQLHPDEVTLFLQDSLPEEVVDSVRISHLADLSGNLLVDTAVPVYFRVPGAYDVVIHEILADPDPPVDLMNAEFVELYNRTGFPVNLENWSFHYGSYSKAFPAMTLPPKGYLLICKDSAWLHIAACALLLTSSTSLSNEGTTLVLKDKHGHVIHTVAYSPDWFGGSFKEEGGWSLEMADSGNPCGCSENWRPSKDASGGTPGRANSVARSNPDEEPPQLQRAFIVDSTRLTVTFSEPMDSLSIMTLNQWQLMPSEENPVQVEPVPPDFRTAALEFSAVFIPGTVYSVRVKGAGRDCSGNTIDTARVLQVAIPEEADAGDLVINEILPDPVSGGVRFVELYNRSEKIIDLQTLVLSDQDTISGGKETASSGDLLFPGEYALLTGDPENISAQYPRADGEVMRRMPEFPVLDDNSGTVILARKNDFLMIDNVQYDKEMHFKMLASTEGVSLERSSPEWPSLERTNWHSAAETEGYATPGYRNSHFLHDTDEDSGIHISPGLFSPDNDGHDDLVLITLREQQPDYSVNMMVYDARGRKIKLLANNVFTGSEGIFIWDGMDETGHKAGIGIYVIVIERVWSDGTVKKAKRTVVLGGKL